MADSEESSIASMSCDESWNTNEPLDSDSSWDVSPGSRDGSQTPTALISESPVNSESLFAENVPVENAVVGEHVAAENVAAENVAAENVAAENIAGEIVIAGSVSADKPPGPDSLISENTAVHVEESHGVEVTDIRTQPVYDVPAGKYTLVGWNIQMTGNRLIDEICQISGYSQNDKFNQFIMPHGNPNNYIREHYGLYILTSGAYRTLRDVATRRPLKTRSELAAINDFLLWLKEIKGETDGVILVCHDIKKMVPLKMIDSVRRYKLFDKFKDVVKGFCNICTLAENKSGETRYFSLKVLSSVLLPRRGDFRRGSHKARACHDVLLELLLGEHHCAIYTNLNRKATKRMSDSQLIRQVCDNIIQHLDNQAEGRKRKRADASELIYQYSVTVNSEDIMLMQFKELLERQNSFRPVFKGLMNFDHLTRQTVNRVRRKLVNNNFAFKDVENAWNKGGCIGLEDLLNHVKHVTEKEFNIIIEIFERHFDPKQDTYLQKLIKERKEQSKKALSKNEVKTDLEKSFTKLPKANVAPEDASFKNHRRIKSL